MAFSQRMLIRAALVLGLLLAAVPAFAGDVRVTVKDIRSDSGAIMIGVYDSNAGFRSAIKRSAEAGLLSDPLRVAGLALRARAGERSVILPELPAGRYAVIAFHDANDDGKLNETPWGVPTEGYGFSNNATAFLAAPTFDAAALEVGPAGAVEISISLAYPREQVRAPQDTDEPSPSKTR
jgi:uncharacterized protein (DUF2141 family)